jgi:hypothetical protein
MKNGKVSFEKVKYEFNFDFEKAKTIISHGFGGVNCLKEDNYDLINPMTGVDAYSTGYKILLLCNMKCATFGKVQACQYSITSIKNKFSSNLEKAKKD